jgi:hypothetical protein
MKRSLDKIVFMFLLIGFIFYHIFPFIVILVLDFFDDTINVSWLDLTSSILNDNESLKNQYLITVFLSSISLFAAYMLYKVLSVSSYINTSKAILVNKKRLKIVLYIFIAIKLALISYLAISTNFTIGVRGAGNFGLFSIFLDISLFYLYALSTSRFSSKWLLILTFILTLMFFLATIFGGGSRRIFVFMVFFIILPIAMFRFDLKAKFIYISGFILVLFVIIFGKFRKISLDSFDSVNFSISDIYLLLDFGSVFESFLKVLMYVPDKVDYLYGATLFKIFLYPIPRELMPSKPESISVIVSKELWNLPGVTMNPGLIGEFYFNFGLFMHPFLFLFILLFFMTFKFFINNFNDLYSKLFITGFFSMTAFNLMRGYTSDVLLNLIVLFIVLFFLKKLLRVRI